MYKVNIVIPSIKGKSHLQNLIPSLEEALVENSIITIVECKSGDEIKELYENNVDIDVICFDEIQSFAKNCNIGAKSKESEYILFLNNDIKVEKNFLEEMLKTMESDELNVVVGAKIYDFKGEQVIHTGVGFIPQGFPFEVKDDINQETEYNAVTAACLLIKKEYFDKVGGFDEEYINGWEDNDLCMKIRELGKRIVCCSKAIVYHKKHGTPDRFQWEAENRLRFGRIWVNTDRIKKIIGEIR